MKLGKTGTITLILIVVIAFVIFFVNQNRIRAEFYDFLEKYHRDETDLMLTYIRDGNVSKDKLNIFITDRELSYDIYRLIEGSKFQSGKEKKIYDIQITLSFYTGSNKIGVFDLYKDYGESKVFISFVSKDGSSDGLVAIDNENVTERIVDYVRNLEGADNPFRKP